MIFCYFLFVVLIDIKLVLDVECGKSLGVWLLLKDFSMLLCISLGLFGMRLFFFMYWIIWVDRVVIVFFVFNEIIYIF